MMKPAFQADADRQAIIEKKLATLDEDVKQAIIEQAELDASWDAAEKRDARRAAFSPRRAQLQAARDAFTWGERQGEDLQLVWAAINGLVALERPGGSLKNRTQWSIRWPA